MRFLSLDTSTSCTGYSLYDGTTLLSYGNIDLKSVKKSDEKFMKMVKQIYDLIDKYNPELICIELTVVLRNPQVQRTLSKLLGCVQGKCIDKDISYYEFRPTEWRKLVKRKNETLPRKREELKQWSIDYVKTEYGIDVESDDVSDSILIGRAYINLFS